MSFDRLMAARRQSIQEHHEMMILDKERRDLEASERAAGRQPPRRREPAGATNADRLAAMRADIHAMKTPRSGHDPR